MMQESRVTLRWLLFEVTNFSRLHGHIADLAGNKFSIFEKQFLQYYE